MKRLQKSKWWLIGCCVIALTGVMLVRPAYAQDRYDQDRYGQDQYDQDDPPSRVARLGYTQGSVSFQPAGESEWVEAVRNRPLTTGDRIWADRDSRAELQLGAAVIDLNSNTGFSFLNLDDRTVQIQLTAGSVDVRVRRLDRNDVFEIDTPNQAFSIFEAGRYRVEASDDGSYTVVSVREGEGESTGNGQTYTVRAGQRATFEGADSLRADVEDLGNPDDFDNWSYDRDRRYENSVSARYVSPDVVGYDDLDDSGDWRPTQEYGNVWFPRVATGWAPYRDGHWAWIDPWGWSWVDEEPWGYAPFHYGRWVSAGNRWGWVPGPREVRPVYAPALVVFVGGNGYGGNGGNVGWFPLGPREVYVPGYRVSRGYVDRVNVSNTVVNRTVITNVYNTTIIKNNTNITNVTYVNRNVSGAMTAVPQRAFVSSQSVARSAVAVNQRDFASAPVMSRVAVVPTSNSVLGSRANTAGRVAAPPAAVANRAVVAKATAPPPPVPFAARQQALDAHPGEGIARQDMRRLRPAANVAAAHPQVKQAPPGKPATPTMNSRGNQPGNPRGNQPGNTPAANQRPDNRGAEPNRPANNQPAPNSPAEPPARNERPGIAQPDNRPNGNPAQPNRPASDNRPVEPPARNERPAQPDNRPDGNPAQPNRPVPNNRPVEPPARNERPAQPDNRPDVNPAQPNRPVPNNRPAEPPARNERPTQPDNRPDANSPQPNRQAPNNRPAEPPARNERPAVPDRSEPNNRPDRQQPAEPKAQPTPDRNDRTPGQAPARPETNTPPQRADRPPAAQQPSDHAVPPQRPLTPAEKKQQDEDRKPNTPPQSV